MFPRKMCAQSSASLKIMILRNSSDSSSDKPASSGYQMYSKFIFMFIFAASPCLHVEGHFIYFFVTASYTSLTHSADLH